MTNTASKTTSTNTTPKIGPKGGGRLRPRTGTGVCTAEGLRMTSGGLSSGTMGVCGKGSGVATGSLSMIGVSGGDAAATGVIGGTGGETSTGSGSG